jgi:hypothetical protein
MVRATGFFGIAVVVAGVAARGNAAELQRATANAWEDYLHGAVARAEARVEGSRPFLWMDERADRALRVQRGEVVVAPLVGHGTQTVPNGLIHDWIGAVFMPKATIESLLCVVHDYDRYKDIYKPVVTDSRSLDSSEAKQEFSMVWQRHVLFVNAAVQGRYRAYDVLLSPRRGYSVIDATTLQQIEDYGGPGQHLLPPDTGGGFIWRMYSISRYEERDGGVYLETEAIVLSRDIPASLRWLVNPVVNHLSVNSLTTTLRQTLAAVESEPVPKERLAVAEHKGLN